MNTEHVRHGLNLAGAVGSVSLAIFLSGCSGKTPPAPQIDAQRQQEQIEELILKPRIEKVQLLALKYKLSTNQVEAIIHSYLKNHDPLFHLLQASGSLSRSNQPARMSSVPETIAYLEREHGIPSDVLASIIIDYQVWEYADQFRDTEREVARESE